MDPRAIWVDFTEIEYDGSVRTLMEFAEPGASIYEGARVCVGDDEGNRCKATVIEVTKDGFVTLVLDLGSFAPATEHAMSLVEEEQKRLLSRYR